MKERFRRHAAWVNNLLNNYYVQSTAGLVLVYMGTKLFNSGYQWIGWPLYHVGWLILLYTVFATFRQLLRTINGKK